MLPSSLLVHPAEGPVGFAPSVRRPPMTKAFSITAPVIVTSDETAFSSVHTTDEQLSTTPPLRMLSISNEPAVNWHPLTIHVYILALVIDSSSVSV
jgi:hypothetical protein